MTHCRTETRGRKEIELLEYVKHVNEQNDLNDVKIAALKNEKEQLEGKPR